LHIGGARTALFNYLFARHHGGTFVLRVEDTDRERSTPEAIRVILDGLRYLGLEWDEGPEKGGGHGPYFQSERLASYTSLVERLLAEGKAYRCFCTKERLQNLRAGQREAKQKYHYDRLCERLDPAEAVSRVKSSEPYVVRFRVPDGADGTAAVTVVDDLIRGKVTFQHEEIEDFIIQRADGTCVYNFAVVGDDHGMGMTHVIRGEDHLSNTPKQILLFQALGFEVPAYAHIPLILAPGGGKLSKRHGAVAVTEYQEKGYLPEAMINFLVRMGWAFDDKKEIFSLAELVEEFSLGGVSKSGAVYDIKKLDHLGNYYMRERRTQEIVDLVLPYIMQAGFLREGELESADGHVAKKLEKMIELEQPRMEHVAQVVEKVRYYFEAPRTFDAGALKVLRKKADMEATVKRYADSLAAAVPESSWRPGEHAVLEAHARKFIEDENLKLGDLAQPLRAILTGRSATPGLFEIMSILGREACSERLGRAEEAFAAAR
jgi:glutamyl-tRNA synthetase